MIRKKDTPESREFWKLAEQIAREVRDWPNWKRAFAEGVGVLAQTPAT